MVTYLLFYFVLPVQSRFNCVEKLVLVDETVGSLLSVERGRGGEGRGVKGLDASRVLAKTSEVPADFRVDFESCVTS